MRWWQWLMFSVQLPKFNALAKQAQTLAFKDRFRLLQTACQNLLKHLKVDLNVIVLHPLDDQTSYYLVSNHQGTFDPILLVAGAPIPHSFISKVENLKLPVIGTWGRLIDFITFKREDHNDNVAMLRQATRYLKEGKSLLVFPEGTRSKSETMLPFKSGALLPAYMAKASILPVALRHAVDFKHARRIQLVYGAPLSFEQYQNLSYDA